VTVAPDSTPPSGKRPLALSVAVGLVFCYAVVLAGVAIALCVSLVTGVGMVGAQNSSLVGTKGVSFLCVMLLAAAAVLVVGAVLLLRRRRGLLMLFPLFALLAFGSIGEVADVVSGSTVLSNLIGGGVLVLAAAPVILRFLPASRRWAPVGAVR
jgi:hypothetical protein